MKIIALCALAWCIFALFTTGCASSGERASTAPTGYPVRADQHVSCEALDHGWVACHPWAVGAWNRAGASQAWVWHQGAVTLILPTWPYGMGERTGGTEPDCANVETGQRCSTRAEWAAVVGR